MCVCCFAERGDNARANSSDVVEDCMSALLGQKMSIAQDRSCSLYEIETNADLLRLT